MSEAASDRAVGLPLKALRGRHILATKAGDKVLRLLPPLVIQRAEIKAFLQALEAVLEERGKSE